MADRYDFDKDRERFGRGDFERGREWDYGNPREGRHSEWDRERRWGSEGPYGGERRERYGEGYNEGWRREDYRRNQPWSGENRTYAGWERPADFGDRGDWGRQGAWGNFGNRPDYGRERNWRESRDIEPGRWDWDRGEWAGAGSYTGGAGAYAGGMGTYSERGRYAGRGPKGWQRSDDRIREDLNERLTDHPDIDASEIEVQVKNGEVTLTGTVDHRQAKRAAEDLAERVSGVKDVHNQLRVQQSAGHEQKAGGAGTTAKR